MSNRPPIFSIIIPCYNQAHFLKEAVSSIIKQDFTQWEVIIVNDGSTDSTQKLAEDFASKESRIRVLNKENGGLSSARNAGMNVANGEIIQFLDADDFVFPECLSMIYSKINASKEIELVRVGYCYSDEMGKRILHEVIANNIANPIDYVLQHNLGPCHSIFIRKQFADAIGSFDEELKSAEDWDYWIRALKAGARLEHISKPLVCYRYVRNSMSRDAFRMYEAFKTVIQRAPVRDSRLKIDSMLNVEYHVDIPGIIRRQLIMCLGVSVMQGKVSESVRLFNQEKSAFDFSFNPSHFSVMYSYLSFRYWNSQADVMNIFKAIYPNFKDFFKQLSLSEREQRLAIDAVFGPVRKIRNQLRYGKLVGGILNRFIK